MDNEKVFDMSVAAANLVNKDCRGAIGCPLTKFPENTAVTMAYVPYQLDRTAFSPSEALLRGTLFTTLYKPFNGGRNR